MAERVEIARLGRRGDGVAETAGGPVYVPYALPGETALIERHGARARLLEVERPSADRTEPFCPYFGTCGGCIAQHMSAALYAGWKRGIVADALAKAHFETRLEPLVDAHGEGRRRVTFHARYTDGKTRVGYMAARSHDLVEIAFCPISEPGLAQAPRAARALAEVLAGSRKPLDIQITATGTGLDVDIRGHGPTSEAARAALIDAAAALDLARLSLHGDMLVERRAPVVLMGPAQVVPPPGAFLQATRAGEEVLSAHVLDACGGARRVADLFAGCGPFALRLAQGREVHAVDGDDAALSALDRAARGTPGLRRVSTDVRDLFRRPLLAPELERFDAVVMDPPRAGAEAQAKQLAAAKIPLVVSVSCDAGTFARDAAILAGAGYALERVVPVDQFKYSAHVEILGVLRREPARREKKGEHDAAKACPGLDPGVDERGTVRVRLSRLRPAWGRGRVPPSGRAEGPPDGKIRGSGEGRRDASPLMGEGGSAAVPAARDRVLRRTPPDARCSQLQELQKAALSAVARRHMVVSLLRRSGA